MERNKMTPVRSPLGTVGSGHTRRQGLSAGTGQPSGPFPPPLRLLRSGPSSPRPRPAFPAHPLCLATGTTVRTGWATPPSGPLEKSASAASRGGMSRLELRRWSCTSAALRNTGAQLISPRRGDRGACRRGCALYERARRCGAAYRAPRSAGGGATPGPAHPASCGGLAGASAATGSPR